MIEPSAGPHPGAISDMLPATVITRTLANSLIPFGSIVMGGPTSLTCYGYGTAGEGGVLGIAVRTPIASPADGHAFVMFETIAILVKGAVWVRVLSGTGTEPAFFDYFGNLTSVSSENTAIPGASFVAGCDPGGMAILRLT